MERDFRGSVEIGLNLAKRLNNSENRSDLAPKPVDPMHKSAETPPNYFPTSPMVYAVISDPGIVDNPDRSSYQPHVSGRCDPPALIPLQMNEIEMKIDCYLDSVLVELTGSWRLHCVSRNQRSNCRLVIPMGEKGSILGVEIDITDRSYSTRLTKMEDTKMKKTTKKEECILTPQVFTLTVPQVDGGSVLSIKVSWFQKLLCIDGHFSLGVPFNFPEYITPSEKGFSNREKIKLNLNPGVGKEVLCKTSSHPLKEIRLQAGKLDFVYEAEDTTWSTTDFYFSYVVKLQVSSSDIFGGLVVQTPSVHDFDQREMFYLYLSTGTENNQNRKVFRNDVVFLVDISESMRGRPLENVKSALSVALSKLAPADSFNIIAFNGETRSFSGSLELASKEMVGIANQWMGKHFIAGGGTNLLHPLNEAMKMLPNTCDSVPQIFLITDGSVDDERNICHTVKTHLKSRGSISPRISTFGIGTYCNHYFLRMLASIGRGHFDAAYDADSINVRIQRLFSTSAVLMNITIEAFDYLDGFEEYPSHIPDLFLGSPSIVSGRYQGNFPDTITAKGILADGIDFSIDLKVQKMKDIPLEKVFAKQQVDLLTAQAWLSESKQLEEKIAKLSIQTGVPSEYTSMILVQNDREMHTSESVGVQKANNTISLLHGSTIGFGNVSASRENIPTIFDADSQASGDTCGRALVYCCTRLCDCCCCMCCIRLCSHMNDQCGIILSQLCAGAAFYCCLACCDACCS